jgi:hypothetical protein
VISSKTGSRKRFGFAKTSVGSGATSPPAHDPGARDDVVPSTWRKNSGEFTIHGERIRESPHTFWRVPAGWLVTALLESQSGRRPAGRSPITRSLSSLATTPRSRNSAIIKLITTRIATKTLLKLASRYLARKSGTGGPACRSPYPRLASGIATLKM